MFSARAFRLAIAALAAAQSALAGDQSLQEALYSGDLEQIQKLVEEDSAIVRGDIGGGTTPLHSAAYREHAERLARRKTTGGERGPAPKETPLHFAARRPPDAPPRFVT